MGGLLNIGPALANRAFSRFLVASPQLPRALHQRRLQDFQRRYGRRLGQDRATGLEPGRQPALDLRPAARLAHHPVIQLPTSGSGILPPPTPYNPFPGQIIAAHGPPPPSLIPFCGIHRYFASRLFKIFDAGSEATYLPCAPHHLSISCRIIITLWKSTPLPCKVPVAPYIYPATHYTMVGLVCLISVGSMEVSRGRVCEQSERVAQYFCVW